VSGRDIGPGSGGDINPMSGGGSGGRPDAKTERPGRKPRDDAPRGGLGVEILRAMGDAGFGKGAHRYAGEGEGSNRTGDRPGDTDPGA
jgi:hypothetical protein